MLRQFILFLFLILSGQIIGQENRDYSKKPYWIAMMEQDGGNYFETVKAFETFWKSRKMPMMVEEEHMTEGPEKTNKEMRKMSKRAVKNRDFNHEMIYQIKRYNRWKRDMEPYVQEDGRILTMDERLKLWREQKSETTTDK